MLNKFKIYPLQVLCMTLVNLSLDTSNTLYSSFIFDEIIFMCFIDLNYRLLKCPVVTYVSHKQFIVRQRLDEYFIWCVAEKFPFHWYWHLLLIFHSSFWILNPRNGAQGKTKSFCFFYKFYIIVLDPYAPYYYSIW